MATRDFQQQLDRQLKFMENSCLLYDSGHREEAIRLATSLRIIFHDTNSCKSLLTHVQATGICMLSTSITHEPNKRCPHTLVRWHGTAGKDDLHAVPLLESAPSVISIAREDWWAKEVIFYGGTIVITRRKLILDAANKDGGAHVDATLDSEYEELVKGIGVSVSFRDADAKTGLPVGDFLKSGLKYSHFAGLRQIAYEVLNTQAIFRLAKR
jgi:hypothetical protein